MPVPEDVGTLLRVPWADPAFGPIAGLLVAVALATAVGIALAGRLGRGGAPGVLWARWRVWVVLASVFVVCCFSGAAATAGLVLVLALLGVREWAALTDLGRLHRVVLAACAAVVVGLAVLGPVALLGAVPVLVLGAMLVPVVAVDTARGMRDLASTVLGTAYLPFQLAFGVLLVAGGATGPVLLFATGAAVAASDIGAYVVGRSIGRHRLTPVLSPNKTVEGLLGNALGPALVLALLSPWLGVPAAVLAVLAAGLAAAAVVGDLFASALKREAGVKDAGSWVPGFGGILDRIDSLIVALPVAWCLVEGLT